MSLHPFAESSLETAIGDANELVGYLGEMALRKPYDPHVRTLLTKANHILRSVNGVRRITKMQDEERDKRVRLVENT